MKKKISKITSVSLAIITLLLMNPVAAHAEWKRDRIGWWYTEGSSWVTGWKEIDGQVYYFDEYGYMAESSLVDNGRYFVDSNGKCASMTDELYEYSDVLNNYEQLKENDYNYENLFFDNKIIDIDQDGIYEMLVNTGTCEADRNIVLYKYKDGQMYTYQIDAGHSFVSGYNSKNKEFIVFRMHMGSVSYRTYKLEDDKLVNVDYMEGNVDTNIYKINGVYISKDKLNNKLEKEFNMVDYIEQYW